MKLQKRNGEQVTFDRRKIEIALEKANTSVAPVDAITSEEIKSIALDVENQCTSIGHIPHVEEVQDLVENALIGKNKTNLVRNYITYRYEHQLRRKANSTDDKILSLLAHKNEEANTENSNKNTQIASVMRDYMAGEVSRDLPYWLLATCAMTCVAMLQAVENVCGFSMSVPEMTVPFCSISSRFTRSQLCICWAK